MQGYLLVSVRPIPGSQVGFVSPWNVPNLIGRSSCTLDLYTTSQISKSFRSKITFVSDRRLWGDSRTFFQRNEWSHFSFPAKVNEVEESRCVTLSSSLTCNYLSFCSHSRSPFSMFRRLPRIFHQTSRLTFTFLFFSLHFRVFNFNFDVKGTRETRCVGGLVGGVTRLTW